jgi:hypothetical protein
MNLSNASNKTESFLTSLDYILVSVKIIVVLISTLLNTLLMYMYIFRFKQKKISDYLFLSIIITDLIIGLLAMGTQTLIDFTENWPLDKITCVFFVFIQYAVPDVTGYALLSLSFHRFMLIVFPFKCKESLNNTLNIILLSSPWIFTLTVWMICITILILHNQFNFTKCDLSPSTDFIIYKELFINILTIFLILILNFYLIHLLNMKKKKFVNNRLKYRIENHKNANKSKTTINKDKKAIKCVIALILSVLFTQINYIITWPINSSSILSADWFDIYYQISMWLSYCTSLTDPIIQLIFNEKIKSKIKEISCLKSRK